MAILHLGLGGPAPFALVAKRNRRCVLGIRVDVHIRGAHDVQRVLAHPLARTIAATAPVEDCVVGVELLDDVHLNHWVRRIPRIAHGYLEPLFREPNP